MAVNLGTSNIFAGSQGNVLANYDWTDIAGGTGYVNYYLARTYTNGVSGARLTDGTFYSDQVCTGVRDAATSGAWKKYIDLDFDVEFLTPKIIKGAAIANIATAIKQNDAFGYHSYVKTTLRKVEGTREIDLVIASGALLYHTGGAGSYGYGIDAIKMEVPTTNFRIGDTLRLTVELYGHDVYDDTPKDANFIIMHDPMNRDESEDGTYDFTGAVTRSVVMIPFKLDI